MSREDFEFAVEATAPLGWELTEADFAFMAELEPEGCFVLLEDSKKIGLATTISYGSLGWFGNLIVLESRRGKGAGSLLVNHSVKYLFDKGVKAVGLYAYVERIHFYERLGFKLDSEFTVLKGKGLDLALNSSVRASEKRDLRGILELDRRCFGADRRKLVEPIVSDGDNLCLVVERERSVVGYAVAKIYGHNGEVGPVVCQAGEEEARFDLLGSILIELSSYEVSMYVPASETNVIAHLEKLGLSGGFHVARMFLGQANLGKCMVMAESLERG